MREYFCNKFIRLDSFFFIPVLLGLYFPRVSASSVPPIACKNVSTSSRELLSRRLFVSHRRVSPRRVNESGCAPRRRPTVEMHFVRCFGNVAHCSTVCDVVSVGPAIAHPHAMYVYECVYALH